MFLSIKEFIDGYTSKFYLEEKVFEKVEVFTLGRTWSPEDLELGLHFCELNVVEEGEVGSFD